MKSPLDRGKLSKTKRAFFLASLFFTRCLPSWILIVLLNAGIVPSVFPFFACCKHPWARTLDNSYRAAQTNLCPERIFPMISVPTNHLRAHFSDDFSADADWQTDGPTHFLGLEMTRTQLICDWRWTVKSSWKTFNSAKICQPNNRHQIQSRNQFYNISTPHTRLKTSRNFFSRIWKSPCVEYFVSFHCL